MKHLDLEVKLQQALIYKFININLNLFIYE